MILSYEEIFHAMRGLTKGKFRALSSVYTGNQYGTGFKWATMDALVSEGLVTRRGIIRTFSDGLPAMRVTVYEIPEIRFHMAWCEVCGKRHRTVSKRGGPS